ncbi:PIN domain-containing protein [Candidatus Daviesbacteria bacterium]|nr:PIN domain-containing protein [Candidatus Daviesbacteria bacterium]
MYLVDTNILIQAINQIEPDYGFIQKIILKNQLYLSVIVVGEYLSRATPEEEKEIEKLIVNFPVLSVNLEEARLAGLYRKKFLKTKRGMLLDYFLAAQAKLNDLILATHNKSDFPMKDIKIITP